MSQSREKKGTPTGGQFGSAQRDEASISFEGLPQPDLEEVLESASRLQELAPDAVLVGGSAAAYYARHRLSYDHDHVIGDLQDRFDMVLDAVESEGEWVTNRVTYGKVILGQLGGIEAGVRQLIRKRPLEFQAVTLTSGASLRVPTMEETLRIKAFLAVRRNQVRDYLDIAALADTMGYAKAATVLDRIDDYYADQHGDGDGVSSQVARQLASPLPKDAKVTNHLHQYKGLVPRWQKWPTVVQACQQVAALMLNEPG